MEKIIGEILEEIFMIDPELKKYQKQLEATMVKMIGNKPETKFDEVFREELKMKLLARAEELGKEAKARPSLWKNLNFWRGFSLAAAVAVFAMLVVMPAIKNGQITMPSFKGGSPLAVISGAMKINQAGERAFGDLGAASQPQINYEGALSSYAPASGAPSSYTPPLGSSPQTMSVTREAAGFGGGGVATGVSEKAVPGVASDVAIIAPRPWPPEEVVTYKYVYAGEEFDLPGPTVEVLRRVKGYGSQNFSSLLRDASLGLLDPSKFLNLKVQHLALLEDKDNGYVVDITPYEGMISISENWQKVMPVYEELPRFREEDVPSDAKLIEVANRFLNQYGIDLSHYGAPEVAEDWKVYAEGTAPADIWIPDVMNISYPLLLDGKAIYEQGGYGKAGFSVSINVRTMKVTGVYGLQTLNFDASSYPAETDKERIMKFVSCGDFWPQPTYPPEEFKVREVEVKLGTPKLEYMRYWRYTGTDSEELYVPALIFPILSVEGNEQLYKKNVIIPLAKEILDSVTAEQNIYPTPVPLIKTEPSAVEKVSE